MDKEATMIRTVDGRCWLNAHDDLGRPRSSYLGKIGSEMAVQSWCAEHGIRFYQEHDRVKSGLSGLRTICN
jgi:hypothetical protein